MTLSLLLLSRWSFGIILYEIATIGMYEVSLFRATRYNKNSGVVFAALVLFKLIQSPNQQAFPLRNM